MRTYTFSDLSKANPLTRTKLKEAVCGFTLVEVIAAGIIMAAVMVAVARLSISGISGSSHQADRSRIEAAINDNIHELVRAESLLTFESIESEGEPEIDNACNDPADYLRRKIENANPLYVPEPGLSDQSGVPLISRTIDTETVPGMTTVIYEFTAPEENIGTEKRRLELNPSFQARCALR